MQSSRRSTSDGEVPQLVSSHPPSSSNTATSFVAAVHITATLSSNRNTVDTANCPSFEWQCFEVNFSICYGKFRQFNAIEYIIVGFIVAAHSNVALQRIEVTARYTARIASKSQVYITVDNRLENDASHRSKAIHE